MYRDYSLHVAQYKALFHGIVYRPTVIGPYTSDYGLAGDYNPKLAAILLNRHK